MHGSMAMTAADAGSLSIKEYSPKQSPGASWLNFILVALPAD